MEKLLFKEEQQFMRNVWWYLLVVSMWLPFLIVAFNLFNEWKKQSDEVLTLTIVLVFLLLIAIFFTWLFIKMRLIVKIRQDGVRFRYPPLFAKWKHISKEDIESFEVRKYNAILEFGGRGIKTKLRRKSVAYTVSGNAGLQLVLKSGKKILLGTHRKQAIMHAINLWK